MKILMVCLGNICRSPMAEGLMRKKIGMFLLDAEVDSAGLSTYHIGEPPDKRAQMTMAAHGIDISGLSSRLFTAADFDKFDRIYVMDSFNYRDIISMARTKSEISKVEYLMNSIEPAKDLSVPDPYYGGQNGFEQVFKMLDNATTAVASAISAEK